MTAYPDRNGHPFEAHRTSLPCLDHWPRIPRVTNSVGKLAMAEFYDEFHGKACWWCERPPFVYGLWMELHHLFAGSRGRAHEPYLFTWLCRECHENHVGEKDLPHLLYLKWKRDRARTDWIYMAVRYGRWLPDLREKK